MYTQTKIWGSLFWEKKDLCYKVGNTVLDCCDHEMEVELKTGSLTEVLLQSSENKL